MSGHDAIMVLYWQAAQSGDPNLIVAVAEAARPAEVSNPPSPNPQDWSSFVPEANTQLFVPIHHAPSA